MNDLQTATASRNRPGRPGRPRVEYSRRKFQEAVAALKGILKNERLAAHLKLRACELLLSCYDVPYSGSDTRATAASVKELVSIHTFEKQLNRQLNMKMLADEQAAEAKAEAEKQEQLQRVFSSVLDDGGEDE